MSSLSRPAAKVVAGWVDSVDIEPLPRTEPLPRAFASVRRSRERQTDHS